MTPDNAKKPLSTPARLHRIAIALGTPQEPLRPGKLAEFFGCGRSTLWRWTSGKSEPLAPFLNRLAEIEKKLNL